MSHTAHAHADHVRNHWWWRPGWRAGRRFYAWHLTFDHAHELHALVDAYQHQLADLPGLDPIPRQWLHLTMQGVGFLDDVDPDQLDQLIHAARARLARVPAPEITFQQPLVHPEAVLLPAAPADSIAAIRDAIRDAFPAAGLGEAPEARDGFLPHVSLAYVNQDGPAEPILAALDHTDPAPARTRITAASLIILNRDHRMYQWRDHSKVPLDRPT